MRWFASLGLLIVLLAPSSQTLAWEEWPSERDSVRLEVGRSGPRAQARPALVDPPPIETAIFRLLVPFRTQKDGGRWQISNCGPASLGMVLDAYGVVGQATDDLRYRSHTYQGTWGARTGTALQHLVHVAEDFGLTGVGLYVEGDQFRNWSLDDLRGQLRLGRPVMVLVRLYLVPGYEGVGGRWGHYLLLTGLSEGGFFYSDSLQTGPESGTARRISAEQLEQAMQNSHIPGQAAAFAGPRPVERRV